MNLGESLRNYIVSFRGVWQDHSGFLRQSKQVTKSIKDTGTAAKKSATYSSQLMKALKRVAVVVPVWMAARAVMRMFTTAISQTVDYIIKMEKALARAKATITGYGGSLDKVGEVIKNNARLLAMAYGRPIEKILEIFYRFSTAGIDVKASMSAMSAVLKTSISMMGDETLVAKTLAGAYILLGKNIKANIPEMKKVEYLGAIIATLWQDNRFDLNEFSGALQRAGTTMSQYGISAENTIAILATMHQQGIKGTRAGRLLEQMFARLSKNMKKVNEELGIVVRDNKPIDWFKYLTTVMEKVNKLGTELPSTVKKMIEIFQVRGLKGFRAQIQDMNKFKDNLELTAQSAEKLFTNLNKLTELQLKTMEAQINIFGNLKREMGHAFLVGITGAGNFTEALIEVNKFMTHTMIPTTMFLANTIRKMRPSQGGWLGRVPPYKEWRKAQEEPWTEKKAKDKYVITEHPKIPAKWKEFQKDWEFIAVEKKVDLLEKMGIKDIDQYLNVWESFFYQYDKFMGKIRSGESLEDPKIKDEITKLKEDLESQLKGRLGIETEINAKYKERLQAVQLEHELTVLGAQGASDIELAYAKLNKTVDNVLNSLKGKVNEEGESLDIVTREELMTALMARDYEKINQMVHDSKIGQEDAIKLLKQMNDLDKERLEVAKKYSEQIRGAFKESFKGLLQGDSDIFGFIESIGNKIRESMTEALSERLTAKFMDMTEFDKMFGEALGKIEIGDQIKIAHDYGADLTYQKIVQGFQEGTAMMGRVGGTGGMYSTNGAPIGGTSYPGGQAPAGYLDPIAKPYSPGYGGYIGHTGSGTPYPGGYAPKGYADPVAKPSMYQKMGGMKGMVSAGMAGGAIGMAAYSGYAEGGAGGAIGAGLMMAGIMTGNPILMGIGFLASIFGSKKKKETKYETSWKPEDVKKMFPYYGMQIPAMPQMYPLGKQRQFGETKGINVEINVNIDKITGTDEEVASEIAENISKKVNIVLAKKYSSDILRGNLGQSVVF